MSPSRVWSAVAIVAVLTVGSAPGSGLRGQDVEQAPDSAPADSTVGTALGALPPARLVQDTTATGELQALFSRIDELRGVTVSVDGGVATLVGETLTQDARTTAVELASERDEVLYVVDRVTVETSLATRFSAVLEELRGTSVEWFVRLPVLIAALAIVGLFAVIARVASASPWLYGRLAATPFTQELSRRLIRLLVWLVGIILALQLLDATAVVGAVVGAAGVAGLAFGFAFRNIAENWLAGVLLGIRRPFDLDDEVSIGGSLGRVVRLTHSDTVLMTPDGNHLRIPNASVYNGLVENYTRNPRRRMRLSLSMRRDADVDRAREAVLGSLADTPVLDTPAPSASVTTVGDSHLVVELLAWVDQTTTGFLRARSIVYRRANEALASVGIPGPTSEHVVFMGADGQDAPEEPAPAAHPGAEGTLEGAVPEEAPADDGLTEQIEEDRARSSDVNLL